MPTEGVGMQQEPWMLKVVWSLLHTGNAVGVKGFRDSMDRSLQLVFGTLWSLGQLFQARRTLTNMGNGSSSRLCLPRTVPVNAYFPDVTFYL